MSAIANATPLVTTVTKPVTNPRDADATPRVNIQELCEEYYEDILPIIMDKVRRDRRKDVHTRLDFGEGPREKTREDSHHSSARARTTKPERVKVQDRLRYGDRHVLDRLGHRRQSAFDRLSETYSPSTTKSRPRGTDSRDHPRGRSRHHSLETSKEDRPKDRERFLSVGDNTMTLSPTPISSRRTRMPNNVKTYDETGDPEDHVKIFQAAAQVERWALPTWCHIFNSTLIGAARIWFDELPPESIDSYKDLKAAFLAYFMQQKKYVKDPVEIHNIKQKDGETIEDFMERFKVKSGRMNGAPECMRISEFMHGVNNPELTKRLNEHVPKTTEEMMITTTAFIRGEAASKKKGHASWKAQDQSKRQNSDKRTPKEILAAEAGKFQPPPPMVTPVEKRRSNKFCDFHNDKGHSTDEYMQLKKQIEELVRAGKLSHLIKEIKHGRDQSKIGKKETTTKDKPMAIYMIQSWQRTTRQKVTQSFERVKEITFPPLAASNRTEGPLIIEAEMGGHMIHRMSLSPYNGIIKRPGIRAIQAVPSTVHEMLKFPVEGGIVIIRSTVLIPTECTSVITSSAEVAIGGTLSNKGRTELCSILKKNLEILAWQPSDMTGVPRDHERGLLPQVAVQSSDGKETRRKLADVCRFHGFEQGLLPLDTVGRRSVLGICSHPRGDKTVPGQNSSCATATVTADNQRGPEPQWEVGRSEKIPFQSSGKILADFLIEMPGENPQAAPVSKTQQEPWTLFTDGSSCMDGSGVRLILINPEGIEFIYALRFQFASSNNEAEYEALIAGLQIAARMGVKNVHVSVNSKLVANQVLGIYVAKEDNMVKNSPRRQKGGKKAPPQGPTVRGNGGNSLQAVVLYAMVKMCWTALDGVCDKRNS
nr:reverse transcriptase domain-containing protein [Tanacetum cinerariifolium]